MLSKKGISALGWMRKKFSSKVQDEHAVSSNIDYNDDKNKDCSQSSGWGDIGPIIYNIKEDDHDTDAISPPNCNEIFLKDTESFLQLDIQQTTHILTMRNWNLFKNITRREIEIHSTKTCDIISKINDNHDLIYFWTLETVLSAESIKTRCKVLAHFILMARSFITNNNNLNDAHAVMSALQTFAVQRLDKTWKKLSSNKLKMFKKLELFYSEADNYSKLTTHMIDVHAVRNIIIPYMALFLKDFEATKYLQHDKRILTLRRNYIVLEDVEKIEKFHSDGTRGVEFSFKWKNILTMSDEKKALLREESNNRSRFLEKPKRFYRTLTVSDISLAN